MLSPEEMGLCQEQIRFLDKKIQPGLTKLMWSFMGTAKNYIRDCVMQVDKVGTHSLSHRAAQV